MRFISYFFCASLALLTVFNGCASSHAEKAKALPPYELHNVYKVSDKDIPRSFKRVALLPIVTAADMGVSDSIASIKASIVQEAHFAKKYEIVDVSPEMLREWINRDQLTALDIWPDALRKILTDRQIDGVLLVEVTQLKGYEPISIGMKSRLVNLSDGKTFWACDEVFDLAVPEIYSGAKHFESGSLLQVGDSKSPGAIEMSPTLVAKYAAYTIFQTLP